MTKKKCNFEIIDPKQESKPYDVLLAALELDHEELRDARIALAWKINEKADQDGHLVLGRCVKVPDLHKEFGAFDFIIVLNREVWDDLRFSDDRKLALLDHELCHAARVEDPESGEPKVDERERPVWRTRKHDIEEFQCVVRRHGVWKRDLELFAEAIVASKKAPLFNGILGEQEKLSESLGDNVTVSVGGKTLETVGDLREAVKDIITPTDDELYADAVKIVREDGKASTSLLQRRLRIGYGRAANLIDKMEELGIVGPAAGPGPRPLLEAQA